MYGNYTQEANDRCFDLVDTELSAIWEDIENTPEDTDADRWRKKLTGIAREYAISGRFALMRILYERARENGLALGGDGWGDSRRGFSYPAGEEMLSFSDVSLEHAEHLSAEEDLRYEKLLLSIAAEHDDDLRSCRTILRRAWYDAASASEADVLRLPEEIRGDAKRLRDARRDIEKNNRSLFKSRLSREEAFQLGHILGFSLAEMQWFLLRVFDIEDGFQYNSSGDLIQAYGFLTGAGRRTVTALREAYDAHAARVAKAELTEREADWTLSGGSALTDLAAKRLERPDEGDAPFMAWLTAQAPYLDLPSRTSLRVFRNLAVYAYDLSRDEEEAPGEGDFVRCIREITELTQEDDITLRTLYEDGRISPRRCRQVAGDIMFANLDMSFSDQKDRTKAWHVITARDDGTPTSTGGVNASRTRLEDILSGELQVEKSDMLYLLWFIANQCWFWNSAPDANRIFDRLADFVEAAQICLENALLPEFYPPHLLEQSMMLSIVCADGEDSSPAELYEAICSSLIVPRKRRAGAGDT